MELTLHFGSSGRDGSKWQASFGTPSFVPQLWLTHTFTAGAKEGELSLPHALTWCYIPIWPRLNHHMPTPGAPSWPGWNWPQSFRLSEGDDQKWRKKKEKHKPPWQGKHCLESKMCKELFCSLAWLILA